MRYIKKIYLHKTLDRAAIIDIGTLKTKFVIAEFDKDLKRKILYKDKKLTVIGRDLDKTDNIIIQKSIDKQVEALKEFMAKIRKYKVKAYRVIGTEALRRAKNSKGVLSIIEKITKQPTDLLTHEDEAKIYFNVIANDLDGDLAVADIGGGSVQLTIGNKDSIASMHLLKTGVYYLQEKFGQSHLPTKQDQDDAWAYVRSEVSKLKLNKNKKIKFVYGSTNIIDFFKETGIKLKKVDHTVEHPYKSATAELLKLYHKLMPYTYEERMEFFPSEPYYMWGADKAIMNVVALCEALGVNDVIPSNMNISDGLLLDLVKKV